MYFFALAYVVVRIYKWLRLQVNRVISLAVTIVIAAFLACAPLSIFVRTGSGLAFVGTLGSYSMGVFLYLLLVTLVADLVLVVMHFVKHPKKVPPKKRALVAGWLVLCVTVGVSAYGFIHADNPVVARYAIDTQTHEQLSASDTQASVLNAEKDQRAVSNAAHTSSAQALSANTTSDASALGASSIQDEPLRIVMLSDLHIGAQGTEARLSRIVDLINEQKPDIVCITGDVFNSDIANVNSVETVIEQLKRIEAPYGVYACLGNHDTGTTVNAMVETLTKADVNVLREDFAVVENVCVVVGRTDNSFMRSDASSARGSFADIVARIGDTSLPIVVLDHNPSHVTEYDANADLVLCGHTHKGQVWPGCLITHASNIVDYGFYQCLDGGPAVVVSSGVGYWGPPMSVGSDSEIVVIDWY